MNQAILVGRIAQDLEIKEQENREVTILTLSVQRSFKNADGEYEYDLIPCVLWNGIVEKTCEYCKKGDCIGIKGRIQTNESGIYIMAERITFLSSNNK